MELKIERVRLRDACKKASKAAGTEKGVKLPVLSGILMQADAGKRTLCLTCTDLSSSMVMKLKDVDVKESGETVIPSKLFTAMLDLLEGDEVEITVRNKVVKYQCGYSTIEQPVFNTDDYPNIGRDFPDSTIRISGLTLLTKQPQIVASKASNTNQNFRGVMLNFTSEKSTATATDGARFSKTKGENIADGDLNLFIPEDALRKLCGIVNPKDELFIGLTKNKAVFITDSFVFTTSLMDGDLSKVENVLSRIIVKYKAVVDAKELTEALDLCISMVQGVDPCVALTLMDDSVVLSVDNENGKIGMDVAASEVISTDGKMFYYNPSFLYEFLKGCKGRVEMLFDEKGFLIMKSGNSEYVVCNRTAPKVKVSETNSKKGKTAKKAA